MMTQPTDPVALERQADLTMKAAKLLRDSPDFQTDPVGVDTLNGLAGQAFTLHAEAEQLRDEASSPR